MVTIIDIIAMMAESFEEVSKTVAGKGVRLLFIKVKRYLYQINNFDGVGFLKFRGDPIAFKSTPFCQLGATFIRLFILFALIM